MGLFKSMQGSFLVQLPLMLVAYVFILYYQQDSMIYHPRRYTEPLGETVDYQVTPLNFQTEDGEQGAFVMRHAEGTSVGRIYLVFGGNAMVGREWIEILAALPQAVVRDTAFVLVDYPGFGDSQGSPSTAAILRTAKEAARWALQDLESDLQEDVRLGAIGHSIGCAAALHLAVEQQAVYELSHVVLSAPFTSLVGMAQVLLPVLKPVPEGLLRVLTSRHAWDNLAAAAQLTGGTPPRIDIIHGTSDEIVPFDMGQELFAELQRLSFNATFESVDAGHNDLLVQKSYRRWMKKIMS